MAETYADRGAWPVDNLEAGIVDDTGAAVTPSGKYVTGIQIATGTINVTYGGQGNQNITGKVLSLQPKVSPNDDVIWLCSFNDGTNRTRLGPGHPVGPDHGPAPKYVPASCRAELIGSIGPQKPLRGLLGNPVTRYAPPLCDHWLQI